MKSNTSNRLLETASSLQRSNVALRVMTDRLAAQLETTPTETTSEQVLTVLDEMLENLSQQFALEEKNGYMAEVLEQFPNWHPQVEHLRQQHDLLYRQLREMRERIAAPSLNGYLGIEVRRQLIDWINTYNEHQQRETALTQDAFTLEPGVGE